MNIPSIISAPAVSVRHVFLKHGFTGISCNEQEVFVLGWMDEEMDTTRASHMFTVPAKRLTDDKLQIDVESASFSGYGQVPDHIKSQADKHLQELFAELRDNSPTKEEMHSYKPLDSELIHD